ncbi:MAG: hypothetical protein ACYTFW_21410 [Planctomycetota bacterium]|jgi:hypothetical protein
MNKQLLTPCPYGADGEAQEGCKHYQPDRRGLCFYYRRINGSEGIHWCDGMYDVKEKEDG